MNYTFSLTSGAYPGTYRFAAGTNPESSTVVTPYYSLAFIDRWRESQLRVLRGAATGVDILDRTESQFSPDYCGAQHPHLRPRRGRLPREPERARARDPRLSGANSGPMTEQQQVFYEGREDDTIYLRVHGIPGVMSFLDYSAAATGMTYRNNNNPAGVTIDGLADAVNPGTLTWESVDGPQGGLTNVHTWSTTVAASKFTSFYRDLASPPAGQTPCQGDAGFYGASGPFINGTINDTNEPANGSAPAERLSGTRTIFFDAPGSANGPLRRQQVSARLTTNLDPPAPGPPTTGHAPGPHAPTGRQLPPEGHAGAQAVARAPLPQGARELPTPPGRAHRSAAPG